MEERGDVVEGCAIIKLVQDNDAAVRILGDEEFDDMRADEPGAASQKN